MIDIIKSNRLIAEFMGLKTHGALSLAKTSVQVYEHQLGLYTTHELKYHSSWDWLVPVVAKIITTELPEQDEPHLNWLPFPRTFGMLNEETGHFMVRFNRHVLHQAPTLIEATYLAVVDFIELNQTES